MTSGNYFRTRRRTPFHKIRRRDALAVAAHTDPVLNYPSLGPVSGCGLCGVPGLPQRHRMVDAIAALIEAGPAASDEEVAVEFGVTVQAAGAVRVWMSMWPGAWQ